MQEQMQMQMEGDDAKDDEGNPGMAQPMQLDQRYNFAYDSYFRL